MGPKYGINKFKILSKSYCLVLPSKSENFGNVVLEAISQKTPVITSKNTPWEILIKHNSGYWVDASVKSIKDASLMDFTLASTQYPELCFINISHGVFFDVITGVFWDIASKTTFPKFSDFEGKTRQ